jgi:hypothetical protein
MHLLNVHHQCSLQASVDCKPSSEAQETLEIKEQLTIDGRPSSFVLNMLVLRTLCCCQLLKKD